jgi:hypothetical protein
MIKLIEPPNQTSSFLCLEEHKRKIAALRQSLIEGENSGDAGELDMKRVKTKARQRAGSES